MKERYPPLSLGGWHFSTHSVQPVHDHGTPHLRWSTSDRALLQALFALTTDTEPIHIIAPADLCTAIYSRAVDIGQDRSRSLSTACFICFATSPRCSRSPAQKEQHGRSPAGKRTSTRSSAAFPRRCGGRPRTKMVPGGHRHRRRTVRRLLPGSTDLHRVAAALNHVSVLPFPSSRWSGRRRAGTGSSRRRAESTSLGTQGPPPRPT